jgi:hypothetical protein
MPEVHQQPQLQAGGLQIILHLRPMLVRQFRRGFQFEHNLFVADKVLLIG